MYPIHEPTVLKIISISSKYPSFVNNCKISIKRDDTIALRINHGHLGLAVIPRRNPKGTKRRMFSISKYGFIEKLILK